LPRSRTTSLTEHGCEVRVAGKPLAFPRGAEAAGAMDGPAEPPNTTEHGCEVRGVFGSVRLCGWTRPVDREIVCVEAAGGSRRTGVMRRRMVPRPRCPVASALGFRCQSTAIPRGMVRRHRAWMRGSAEHQGCGGQGWPRSRETKSSRRNRAERPLRETHP